MRRCCSRPQRCTTVTPPRPRGHARGRRNNWQPQPRGLGGGTVVQRCGLQQRCMVRCTLQSNGIDFHTIAQQIALAVAGRPSCAHHHRERLLCLLLLPHCKCLQCPPQAVLPPPSAPKPYPPGTPPCPLPNLGSTICFLGRPATATCHMRSPASGWVVWLPSPLHLPRRGKRCTWPRWTLKMRSGVHNCPECGFAYLWCRGQGEEA